MPYDRVDNGPIDTGRDPNGLEQGLARVVEAAFQRHGTVSAPRIGNVTLIKAPVRDRHAMRIERNP